MAAYFDTGFSVRKPMWHGEGLVLDDYPIDWDDARKKAGLEWEPELRPIYTLAGFPWCPSCSAMLGQPHQASCGAIDGEHEVLLGETPATLVLADNTKGVVRSDTEAMLGTVSNTFELIDHAEMGRIIEALCGETNVKFETAGSCKGGAQVWALVYLDEPYTVAGDDSQHLPFLAVLNSHDGTGACKATMCQTRVVCWNTVQAASMEGDRHGAQYVFRHTTGAKMRVADFVADAKAALGGLRTEAAAWQAIGDELVQYDVDDTMLSHFVSEFIPMPEANVVSDRVRENITHAQATFRSLFLDGVTCEGHRGNALGLLDASVEYLDHLRGFRNADTYLGRTLLRPEPLKAKALTIVRSLVSA